jgi:cytochrome c-type biogenesis protein
MSFASLVALYVAGLATFVSPCVLPLLPVYLAVLGGSQESRRGRLALAGVGFAIGLSLVFVALGMGASVAAAALASHRRLLMRVAGGLMLVLGLQLSGVLRFTRLDYELRPLLARVPSPGGFFGGLLFGVAFALGWTPCVGPVLGATLSYAATHASTPASAGVELASYALGLSTPLVAAAIAAPRALALVKRLRSITPVVQRAMGAMLVCIGLLVATDRVGALAPTESNSVASARACDLPGANACSIEESAPPSSDAITLPTGRTHLVEFVSGHCTVCAKLAPLVAELERACTSGDGSIVRVNVDTASGRALASHFGVEFVPTFLELDAQGTEVERVIGEQSRAELALALASVRGEACPVL